MAYAPTPAAIAFAAEAAQEFDSGKTRATIRARGSSGGMCVSAPTCATSLKYWGFLLPLRQ